MTGRYITAILAGMMVLPGAADAYVSSLEIDERIIVANGQTFGRYGRYERLSGQVCISIDPQLSANAVIANIDRAPADADGNVEACANFMVLQPEDPNRRSGDGLLEVSNRGGKASLTYFNSGAVGSRSPEFADEFGDGFLMQQGFTVMWVGWQYDVDPSDSRLKLDAPRAPGVTGLVRHDLVVSADRPSMSLGHRGQPGFYEVDDASSPENVLTVRESRNGARRIIPRDRWRFGQVLEDGTFESSRLHITLVGGFKAGRIYELVYTARDPVVGGLGLAMIRDFAAYAKFDRETPFPVENMLGWGVSQTGRFLRHFLYQGFNEAEDGHRVFDGLLIHTAGAGRGSFNHSFSQPSRDAHQFSTFFYPTDIFPFASARLEDPITGEDEGLFDAVSSLAVMPRIFYTNTGYEYWGRAASLLHTNLRGNRDVRLLDHERIYHIASAQHFVTAKPPAENRCAAFGANPDIGAPVNFKPNLRALLIHLRDWSLGVSRPPESRYPSNQDRTLVSIDALRYPALPGFKAPDRLHTAYVADYGPRFRDQGIVDKQPPEILGEIEPRVSAVDELGNEVAGVRNVEIAAPLATYLPWSRRGGPYAPIAAPDEMALFCGSFLPLSTDSAMNELTGDTRPGLDQLYGSRDAYEAAATLAAQDLVDQGFLLAMDVPAVVADQLALWDYLHGSMLPATPQDGR